MYDPDVRYTIHETLSSSSSSSSPPLSSNPPFGGSRAGKRGSLCCSCCSNTATTNTATNTITTTTTTSSSGGNTDTYGRSTEDKREGSDSDQTIPLRPLDGQSTGTSVGTVGGGADLETIHHDIAEGDDDDNDDDDDVDLDMFVKSGDSGDGSYYKEKPLSPSTSSCSSSCSSSSTSSSSTSSSSSDDDDDDDYKIEDMVDKAIATTPPEERAASMSSALVVISSDEEKNVVPVNNNGDTDDSEETVAVAGSKTSINNTGQSTSVFRCCCCCRNDKKKQQRKRRQLRQKQLEDANKDKGKSKEKEKDREKSSCCCKRKKNKEKDKAKKKDVDKAKCCSRFILCCKSFLAFFFSNIGLCSLVIGYSILGGFIFQRLEAPNEKHERGTVSLHRQRHVVRLWNLTEELNVLHEENWSRIADEVLLDFQKEVFVAIKKQGWDGKDGTAELQWSFAGALLYSVTVITTIGYGHIAPKTTYGRIVTIFYALVGIPLTLLCLANLGSVLGTGFRCFYKHTCRFLCCLCCKTGSPRAKKSIRYRTAAAQQEEVHEPLRGNQDDNVTLEIDKCEISELDDITDSKKKKSEKGKKDYTRVPIIISTMLMAIYIFGGAMLFSLWEEDWDYLIGSYFCFITLSTIGFGDFVPGTNVDSWKNQEKLILCALYLVFGLALIAMCFDLMQEEVKAKCLWLGQKLGILDSEK